MPRLLPILALSAALGSSIAPALALDDSRAGRPDGLDRLEVGGATNLPAPGTLDRTLAGTPNPDAIKVAPGNGVSFCPALSCIRGPGGDASVPAFFDHQRASLLISGSSQVDGSAQEQLLAVIGTVATGRVTPWKPNTAYKVGDNVNVVNANETGAVYRATTAGTSRTTPPPAHRPANLPFTIEDGSVIWEWINDPVLAAKVNVYNEQKVKPGAGSTWGQATNVMLDKGLIPTFNVNTELDFGNDSGTDCGFENGNCYNLFIRSGGRNMLTSQVSIESVPTGPWSAYFGLRVTGPKTAKLADIVTDSSGAVGVGICSSGTDKCTHATASILDQSVSPVGLKLSGGYAAYAIQAPGFSVDGTGFVRASGINILTGAPASSKAPCHVGDFRFDGAYIYACTAANTWKRAALASW